MSRSRARRGEGEKLRHEILQAAETLLMETASQDAVSIRAVANVVGVTPPSIYRHFADKDRLLLEVCRQRFTEFSVALEEAAGDLPLKQQLEALARAYVGYAVEHPEHYRIMFMARFELSTQEYAEEMVTEGTAFNHLLRVVTALVDSDMVHPQLAERGVLHVSVLLWSAVHGLASLFVAKPGLPWPDRDALIDDVTAMALRSILRSP